MTCTDTLPQSLWNKYDCLANSIKVGVSHSTFVLVKAVKLGFLMAGSSEMVGISLNLVLCVCKLGNFRYFDILIINVVLNLKLKLSEQIEWNPGKSLKNIDNIMESRISAHLFLPIIYRRIWAPFPIRNHVLFFQKHKIPKSWNVCKLMYMYLLSNTLANFSTKM